MMRENTERILHDFTYFIHCCAAQSGLSKMEGLNSNDSYNKNSSFMNNYGDNAMMIKW